MSPNGSHPFTCQHCVTLAISALRDRAQPCHPSQGSGRVPTHRDLKRCHHPTRSWVTYILVDYCAMSVEHVCQYLTDRLLESPRGSQFFD